MLCSILIPSRGRFDRLLKTIESIIRTAGGDDFEILVRLDLDDKNSLSNLHRLAAYPCVKAVVGHRLGGYADIDPIFNTELARLSPARWVWLLNDDAEVQGDNWLAKLRFVLHEKTVVQPEIIRLGGSTYIRCDWTNFPIVPNGCWKDFTPPVIPIAADNAFYQILNIQKHWQVSYLAGISVSHQRDNDEALAAHRKIG